MKPIDALMQSIAACSYLDTHRGKPPGALIERMTPEVRSALKNLTSDDIGPSKLRVHEAYMLPFKEDGMWTKTRLKGV